MADIASLQVVVNADTSAAERSLDSFGAKVGSVGSTVTAALGGALIGSTVALGAALVGSVKSAAEFEKGLSAIGAVSGATASDMDAIRQTALQLGKDTSYSASEAAAGMEEMIKAGVSLEATMQGGARAALDLAAAGGTSVPEAAAIMSNAMNTFRDDMLSAGETANIITGAANASAIGVTDFGFSLSAVGAIAAQVGLPLKDTATAIAVLGQNGLKGSDAGTSLKAMLNGLVPATDKAQAKFNELGLETFNVQAAMDLLRSKGLQPVSEEAGALNHQIQTQISGIDDYSKATKKQREAHMETMRTSGALKNAFFDETGAVKGSAEIAEILQQSLGDLSREQQLLTLRTLFGTDGQRAASLMMKEGRSGVEAMTEAMEKQGDARRIADERLNNLAGSWEKFNGSVETAAIIIGSMFTPALKSMTDSATEFVNQAVEIIEQLPDAWRTVGEAFAGEWEPSETLSPFINMVGQVGIVVGKMYTVVEPLITQLGVVVTNVLAGDIPAAFQAWLVYLGGVYALLLPILAQWAQAFIDWVAPMIPPLLAEVARLGAELLAWIGAQVPVWTQAFTAWATEWWNWLVVAAPFLIDAAQAFIDPLLEWIADQIPPIIEQLLKWGQEFVAWVAPMIPPLLAQLAALGADLLEWIGKQIPPIIEQLVKWGAEFIAWVAPQIPPLLKALGDLYIKLQDWMIDQIPGITAELVKWGLLFGAWVLAEGVPALVKALPGILTALNDWTVHAADEVVKLLAKLGTAVATGIYNGFQEAWKTIGPKILESISSIKLPSWMGGGGGSGMTSLSYGGGSSGNADWDRIAREEGVDPGLLASLIQQESGGNQSARSGAGAIGLTQLMPGTAAGMGIDPYDPEQNVRGGARYLREMLNRFGDEERALIAYNAGPGGGITGESKAYAQRVLQGRVRVPNAGMGDIRISQAQWGASAGMTPQEAAAACGPYAAYLFAQATGRTPNPAEAEQLARAAGWTEAGMGGTGNFMRLLGMQGVNAVRMGTSGMSAADITSMAANAGPMTGFSTPGHYFASTGFDPSSGKFNVGATGTFAGGSTWMTVAEMSALMGPIQDIITLGGQMGVAFTTGGKQVTDGVGIMGPATTAAAGEVTSAFGTMATGVAGQTQATLTSVTDLGGAMMTTTTDAAGSVITTIADMSGNVTSQYATLANGVSLTMGDMSAGVLTSTTDMGTGIMTTVQDMSGNYITTITDLQGNVTSQYTTLASSATAATADMSQGVTAEVAAMSQETLTSVTDMGTGTLTITQNAAGEMVATITDMAGNVTSQYTTMGSDVTGSVEEMAGTVVEQVGEVTSAFEGANSPIEGFQEVLENIEPPDFSDIVSEFEDVEKAAKDAQKAAEKAADAWGDLPGKGGGGAAKGLGKRAMGGPVNFGEMYLVGEQGPELFSPFANGQIIPNHKISAGGGGDTYVVSVNVNGSLLANRRDIEEAVIVGLESAQRRGRI